MEIPVVVKQEILIPPSEPTPNHILQLSSLDSQLFVRFSFKFMFVYQPAAHEVDRVSITNKFKSGLGKVLVPYYPLAGRLRHPTDDGSALEIDCQAQGVLFVDAASDATVAEFEAAPTHSFKWKQFLSLHADDVLKGDPVLILQLTWLSDGGAVLAVCLNHIMADGTGIGEFLNSLGDLAQGKREIDELKTKPTWSRHVLDPMPFESTRDYSLSHPEFGKIADVSGYFASRYAKEQFIPTIITFDRNKINELKKKLTEAKPTSFDVVSALVWRSWARALNLPSDQKVKLMFSISIRQKVKPNLPSGYYGNGFILGYAETSVGDLIEKGSGYAVELVMKAKERVTNEHVREVVEAVSWNRANVDSVGALIMTSWSWIGFDEVDFGIGKPINVVPPCPNNICKLLPAPPMANAIKVSLAVPSGSVEQYLHFMNNIDA